MATWHCIQHCGACCHLAPEERTDIADYLTPEAFAHYLSLVGPEGWCIHLDRETRVCRIYNNRPDFCRVQPDTFQHMFGIAPEDLNDFAIQCCQEQIEAVYGNRSLESFRFEQAVGLIL